MKKCIRCLIDKPLSEFWRHSGKRKPPADGKLSHCKKCGYLSSKAWYEKNKEYAASQRRAWNASHPEIVRKWNERKKNIQKYQELHRKASSRYTLKNRDKTRNAINKWRLKNLDKRASYTAQRRAEKLNATPSWAKKFFIEEAYALAKHRSVLMSGGHKWHVDHIVPLKNKLVCGLHVENNFQVIPEIHNVLKSNRHWPDMPREV